MAVKYSKSSFVINLLLIQLTFLFTASPHYHVEGRSFNKREIPMGIEKETTTPPVRITTIPTSIASIIESLDSSEHHNTDLPSASLSEAPVTLTSTTSTSTTTASTLITESRSNAITSNLNSFPTKPTRPANRSLYEELKASSSFPSFPTFSSNFMKDDEFRLTSIESEEDPGSLERKFKEDETGFKNNETNVERTFVREGIFDESHLAYSSVSSLTTSTTTEAATTIAHLTEAPVTTEASPSKESKSEIVGTNSPDIPDPLPTVSNKKGKYLDLIPHENDDNINYTIPNAAEVWALAGMLNVDNTRKRPQNENKSVVLDTHNGDIDDNLAPVNNNQNNTIKNLLDWMEIEKMSNQNETNLKMENSDEDQQEKVKVNTTKNIVVNELNAENEDPATSENVFTIRVYEASSSTPSVVPHSSTTQAALDNGIEVIDLLNKTHVPISRIDVDIFSKSGEEQEFEDKNVELIDPFQSNGDTNNVQKTKENLKILTTVQEINSYFTTTDSPEEFTTETNFEMDERTTTESPVEGTTSIVDSFTVIGEDEDINGSGDDIFKRTITEVPPTTTDGASLVQTTTDLPSTTTMLPKLVTIVTTTERELMTEMTTETINPAINEIPESTERYNKSTEKTSTTIRFATTTQSIPESKETTIVDFERQSSTIIPNYVEFKPIDTTKNPPEVAQKQVKQNQTIEIIDDDKFKYSTVINIDFPETTIVPMTEFNPTIVTKSEVTNGVDATTLASELLKNQDDENSSNIILISSLSVVGIIVVGFLAFFLFMKKRQKQLTYGQRCRPVGLDAYSLDNVSVYNSVRRKANALRLSKRSYGNSAFEDPSLQSNVLDYQSLQDFSKNKMSIQDEFKEIPQLSVRVDEVPEGCEEKNRYANVVPYPETRVHLKRLNDDEKTEYINANFVKGPKDNTNYYIATQAPLENTIADFWRMIWEQNSKVIIMATDLTENGVERCSEYIPPSVVLDNTQTFGDYQVTLKGREVKDKYAVSQLHLKNLKTNTWREIMHLWYSWPENGSPSDESSVISLLLEARSCLRTSLPDQLDENSNAENNNNIDNIKDKLSTLEKTKSLQRVQGPLTVHCSPGTGRTGTLIACDIILRQLETPPRKIDIPQIVYSVRRGRASAVRAKDQYEFIYKVANSYAIKLNTVPTET